MPFTSDRCMWDVCCVIMFDSTFLYQRKKIIKVSRKFSYKFVDLFINLETSFIKSNVYNVL